MHILKVEWLLIKGVVNKAAKPLGYCSKKEAGFDSLKDPRTIKHRSLRFKPPCDLGTDYLQLQGAHGKFGNLKTILLLVLLNRM